MIRLCVERIPFLALQGSIIFFGQEVFRLSDRTGRHRLGRKFNAFLQKVVIDLRIGSHIAQTRIQVLHSFSMIAEKMTNFMIKNALGIFHRPPVQNGSIVVESPIHIHCQCS